MTIMGERRTASPVVEGVVPLGLSGHVPAVAQDDQLPASAGAAVLPKLVALLLAVLTGGVFWTAFPDVGFWPATLIGTGLLWFVLTRSGVRPGWNALLGLLAGLAFFGPHVWWASIATALVPWIALTLLQAAFWAALGWCWAWVSRLPWLTGSAWRQALAFAVLFTGIEQWRSSIPFGGFPWGRLAWSVAGVTPGRLAWVGGSVLVTFALAYAATLLAATVAAVAHARRWPTEAKRYIGNQPGFADFDAARAEAVAAEAVAAGEFGDGPVASVVSRTNGLPLLVAVLVLMLPRWLPLPHDAAVAGNPTQIAGTNRVPWVDAGIGTAETGILQVGIAQGNVFNPGLPPSQNADAVLRSHLDATQLLIDDEFLRAASSMAPPPDAYGEPLWSNGYDVVVWPENAAAWDPARWPTIAAVLDEYAGQLDAPILVGSMEYPEAGGRYNVMLLWESGTGTIARYAKQRPAPFGEYIPLRSFARLLTDQVDRLTIDMIAADNPPIVVWYVPQLGREVTMGLGICFEVAYDQIFFDAARRGAELMVVPTNNASFGVTPQSTQQLQMTAMQAITTGRAAIQISTVGVSGVFTPDGQLVASTNLWEQDRISALLPLRTTITPAVRLGMGPAYLFQALALGLPLAGFLAGHLSRRQQVAR